MPENSVPHRRLGRPDRDTRSGPPPQPGPVQLNDRRDQPECPIRRQAIEPAATDQVVCHGDRHALNVIGHYTVLDWELATIAEPAFDIARTRLLLNAVPIDMSRAARPIVQWLGRRAASNFEKGYAERRPLDEDAVAWYEAFHALRILTRVKAAEVSTRLPSEAVAAAWAPTAQFLAAHLRQITGLNVNPGVRSHN